MRVGRLGGRSFGRLPAPLGGGAERPGPPQAQGVVPPALLRRRRGVPSLAAGGRVALAVAGRRELPLPAGRRQQRHEGMNTEEDGRRIEKRDSRKAIRLVSGAALVEH